MKKALCAVLTVATMCSLLLSLFACSSRQKKFSDEYFDFFDSYARITVYTDSETDFDTYNFHFAEKLEYYHRIFDIYNEYDGTVNLCTLNKKAASETVNVDLVLCDFLNEAKRIHTLTGGYTSVTLGSVTSIWKQAIKEKTLPDEDMLAEASTHTDINGLVIDAEQMTVCFSDSRLQLDVGALAKGYAAKSIALDLKHLGAQSFMIDLGGTICAHGEKPKGQPWRGGIEGTDLSFEISDRVLSTSASHYRGFDSDGVRYHHIISPETLKPENTFLSVSVLTDNGIDADALSTALFSMSLEDGKELIDSVNDAKAVWILADGTVVQ